eukprot:2082040-Amphidinium_carterae.1
MGIHSVSALEFAADGLLEDRCFAMEAKSQHHLVKVTPLSGRSTVVAASRDHEMLILGMSLPCAAGGSAWLTM